MTRPESRLMRHVVVLLASVLLPLVAGAQAPAPAAPQQGSSGFQPEMQEWKVPWERTRPRDPAVGRNGEIWFVGQEGNYVAKLDTKTGSFDRYEIDPGTHPHNLVLDRQGRPWYAGNRNGMIGRIDPATRAITRFPVPDSTVRDPHTLIFDRKGDLWFTAQNSNAVGRLDVTTGKYDMVKIPGGPARPYGIVLDSKQQPWFDLFGTNKIGTIDPATMELRTFTLPAERARPRRIALTSDDVVWYVDYSRGYLGRLDPKTGSVKEWQNPGGPASLPYAMTVDDENRLWFVETGPKPNRFVGFDPKTEQFFSVAPVPSGGGTIRHMVFDRTTRQIWFGSDVGTIGSVTVGPVRPVP